MIKSNDGNGASSGGQQYGWTLPKRGHEDFRRLAMRNKSNIEPERNWCPPCQRFSTASDTTSSLWSALDGGRMPFIMFILDQLLSIKWHHTTTRAYFRFSSLACWNPHFPQHFYHREPWQSFGLRSQALSYSRNSRSFGLRSWHNLGVLNRRIWWVGKRHKTTLMTINQPIIRHRGEGTSRSHLE